MARGAAADSALSALTLSVAADAMAICRLDAAADIPAWATRRAFFSITRTANELSVICQAAVVPPDVRAERDWRIMSLRGPLDFSLVGVMLALASPLAQAGISIMPVATYDTDHLLVRASRLDEAVTCLRAAGHHVEMEPGGPSSSR